MNQKQVIFNVGGALSVYTEWDNKKLLIDLGSSIDFNPVKDFLLPLFDTRCESKPNSKYYIDQLIISHPHKDHISAINDFDEYFHPELLTCPSDNKKTDDGSNVPDKLLINWDLLEDKKDPSIEVLRKMLCGRSQPLRPTNKNSEFLYWIDPGAVEENQDLVNESYLNNISIAVLLIINGHSIFCQETCKKRQ